MWGDGATISGIASVVRVERDGGLRSASSGTGSVSIDGLLEDGMAAGKAGGKASLLQNERVRLAVCFLGVFVCYFYYGILQETM